MPDSKLSPVFSSRSQSFPAYIIIAEYAGDVSFYIIPLFEIILKEFLHSVKGNIIIASAVV